MTPVFEKYNQNELGGRIEIQKVNNSTDDLIKVKSFEVKYMGERPSIRYEKSKILSTYDHKKRDDLIL